MGMVHFRDSGFTNDMHPRIFDDFSAMFPDGFIGINPKKLSIGLAEKDDPERN
jgi:hypothetical protein